MNRLKISNLIFTKTDSVYDDKIEYEHIIDNSDKLLFNYTCLIIDFHIKQKMALFYFKSTFYSQNFYMAEVHNDNYQEFLDNESIKIMKKFNDLLNGLTRISHEVKRSYDYLDKMLPERILL